MVVHLKIAHSIHLHETPPQSFVRSTRGGGLEPDPGAYRQHLEVERQHSVIFVLEKVIFLSSNWASACYKNQTEEESVQNMGSFTDTVVKETWAETSSVDQLTSRWSLPTLKKEKFSKSPETLPWRWAYKLQGPGWNHFQARQREKKKTFLEKK